ncbi:MAG: hypothetical protein ILA29_05000 [Prevotella sp.]|nr:hypothetical protein [Prevotella sp.]
MNRRFLFVIALLVGCLSMQAGRKQWTEKQAWEWYNRIGVIKGFNQPEPAYPGQDRKEILKKAAEMGLNSVRFWVGGRNAEERVEYIRGMIADAKLFGLTISPVLAIPVPGLRNAEKELSADIIKEFEQQVRDVVRPFAREKQISFWDLWNEPRFEDIPLTYREMDLIEKMVIWCRDENLSQPITSSIIWASPNTDNKALKRTTEVEAMMDIHNFHSYDCSLQFSKNIYEMLDYIKSISDRPIVATECLTRVNGSGVARSLAVLAKYKASFYIWGLYVNDRNWEARWTRSTYDPYDPMFHNVLYSDGDIYDAREIELIRNYRYAQPDEDLDPGLEKTDRWDHSRAWRWMATGPLMGTNITADMPNEGDCNAIRIKMEYNDWKADRDAFLKNMDNQLSRAQRRGMTVMPVLLDDNDATADKAELAKYVGDVVNRFYCDTRIKAWDLYDQPGRIITDTQRLSEIITEVFRYARNQYSNQPLTMTPVVSVKTFEEGFDPWKALVHGVTGGWSRLSYSGGSTSDLVYKIWCLSDVISFATDMAPAETRWLISICYRFGRPIFCTTWDTSRTSDMAAQLKNFSDFHVYWFADRPLPAQTELFRFAQTSTQRQVTEGI